MELALNKPAYAEVALARAGLDRHVDLKTGDALQMLEALDTPIDFVLVDLWKIYTSHASIYLPRDGLVERWVAESSSAG